MNIIICAATQLELKNFNVKNINSKHTISTESHGVGLLEASSNITAMCFSKPDLIIQCGIAGSYNDDLPLGQLVFVKEEELGDCGAEDHEQIIHSTAFPFVNESEFPFKNGKLINELPFNLNIPFVTGLTVNLCAGNESTINYRKKRFNADVESMEGAALHYAALKYNIPFLQIRAISNYIEPRNISNWQTELAINAYSIYIIELLNNLPL